MLKILCSTERVVLKKMVRKGGEPMTKCTRGRHGVRKSRWTEEVMRKSDRKRKKEKNIWEAVAAAATAGGATKAQELTLGGGSEGFNKAQCDLNLPT